MSDLHLYTIYDKPIDYPHGFVVRRWTAQSDGTLVAAGTAITNIATLEEARKFVPPGMVRTERHPEDDAVIVETWV